MKEKMSQVYLNKVTSEQSEFKKLGALKSL